MPFDINTATAIDDKPAPTGRFDLNTAVPVDEKETIYRDDTNEVISAPKGLPADHVMFLDDTVNRKKPKGDFWGMQALRGLGNFAASTPQMAASEMQRSSDAFSETYNNDFGFSDVVNIVNPFANVGSTTGSIAKLKEAFGADVSLSLDRNEKLAQSAVALKEKNQRFLDDTGLSKQEGDGVAFDIGSGLGSVASSVAMTFLTKNPAYAAAFFGELQRSQGYTEAIAAGKTPEQARNISNVMGALEGGIEALGGKIFLDAAASSGFIKKIIKRSVNEAVQEGTQTAAEELVTQGADVRKKDLPGALQRIAYSAAIGFVVSAPVNSVVSYAERSAINAGATQEQATAFVQNLVNNKDAIETEVATIMGNEASETASDPKAAAMTAQIIQKFQTGQPIDPNARQISTGGDRVDPGAAQPKLTIPQKGAPSAELTAQELQQYSGYVDEKPGVFDVPMKAAAAVGKGFDKITLPISERLRAVSEPLMYKLRRFEIGTKSKIQQDEKAFVPFLEKFKKMNKQDRKVLDVAMKNADSAVIAKIANKYGMTQEIQTMRDALNAAYDRAQASGIDVGYREDFFPRLIKDPQGLLDHLAGKEYWNVIEEAIKNKEAATGKTLSTAERAEVANTLLRGFKVGDVSLSKSGVFKGRSIDEITPEIDKFYETTDQALIHYAVAANENIEAAKLFGKGNDFSKGENLDNSIGAYVDGLVRSGEINSSQAQEVKDVLGARFNKGKIGSVASTAKDMAYLATMGSNIGSTITQISDLAITASKMGILRTAKATGAALRADTKVSLEDVGVKRIAQEFENKTVLGGVVEKTFEMTGLSKVDRFGKRTLLEASYNKNLADAKKNSNSFNEKIGLMFGENAAQVKKDLLAGNITEDVKFIIANDLLDLQPVALSEMPEQYLRSGNGRLFYVLKTFTLKQISIYRREGVNKIIQGAKVGDTKLIAQGLGNIVRLMSFMVVAGVGRDYIWEFMKQIPDMIAGEDYEPPELDDEVIANMYKAFGLSKYTFDQMTADYKPASPGDVLFDFIKPPTKTTDNMWRDWQDLQSKKGLDYKDMRTLRSIPVGGELYWFWFGGGSEPKKKQSKAKYKPGSSSD